MYSLVTDLLAPYTFCCLTLALAVAWLWRGRKAIPLSAGRLLLFALPAVVLILMSIPALVYPLLGTLEWQYPPQDDRPTDAEAIVVLDGGVRFPDAMRRDAELNFDSMRRCVHAAKLYHQGKPCPMVVPSGVPDPAGSGMIAAEAVADFLVLLGVKRSDLILETKSRTTYENAVECCRLLEERGFRRVVLVTDATHLCRAVRCFRRQGLEVSPSGCWYEASEFRWEAKTFLPSPGAAHSFGSVVHEWLGMGWYWLNGRI